VGPFWEDEIRSFREGGSETQTNISVILISVRLISELISMVLNVTHRDIRYFDIWKFMSDIKMLISGLNISNPRLDKLVISKIG
jgi:hypothetical protein